VLPRRNTILVDYAMPDSQLTVNDERVGIYVGGSPWTYVDMGGLSADLQRIADPSTGVRGRRFELKIRRLRTATVHRNPLISSGSPVNCLSKRG